MTTTSNSALGRAAGVTVLVLTLTTAGLLGPTGTASAATTTRYVTVGGNDRLASTPPNTCLSAADPCATIAHAIDEAAAGDTIDIGPGTFTGSLTIQKSLTLDGSGTGSTVVTGDGDTAVRIASDGPAVAVTVRGIAISGNSNGTGVDADGRVTVHLQGSSISHIDGDGVDIHSGAAVTMTDSSVEHNAVDGIRVSTGSVALVSTGVDHNGLDGIQLSTVDSSATVTDSTVESNTGDGIQLLPRTENLLPGTAPVVTLTRSTASHNGQSGLDVFAGPGDSSASPTAGVAMKVVGSDVSGNGMSGVFSNQNLSMLGSTVNRNADNGLSLGASATVDATTFDANSGNGIHSQGAHLHVVASTISRTSAIPLSGGSVNGAGIGVFAGGTLALSDSTVVANTGQGVLTVDGTTTIDNSTISGTTRAQDAGYASGGVVVGSLAPAAGATTPAAGNASATVTGSIVGSQSAGVPDCVGGVTDGGYDLSSDAADSCGFGPVSHDLVRKDPKLGALADNGGPTKTQLIGKGSPAVDVIPAGTPGCSAGAADQRGVSRPQGGRCDIGAVEAKQQPLVVSPESLPNGTVGVAYSVTLRATGGLGAPYAFSLDPGGAPLPPGLVLRADGTISGTPTTAGRYRVTISVDDPTLKTLMIVIATAAAPSSSPAAPSSSPVPTTPSASPTTSPLSVTGSDVASLAGAALLAVLLGIGLVVAGARRRPGRHGG